MKKFTITNVKTITDIGNFDPKLTGYEIEGDDNMQVSDGYHTMDELYEHRITLFIALCRTFKREYDMIDVWRSKLHSDGSSFDGWFILGIGRRQGEQITYHLPIEKWEETDFAETLDNDPEWDGHTPSDVLERLKEL